MHLRAYQRTVGAQSSGYCWLGGAVRPHTSKLRMGSSEVYSPYTNQPFILAPPSRLAGQERRRKRANQRTVAQAEGGWSRDCFKIAHQEINKQHCLKKTFNITSKSETFLNLNQQPPFSQQPTRIWSCILILLLFLLGHAAWLRGRTILYIICLPSARMRVKYHAPVKASRVRCLNKDEKTPPHDEAMLQKLLALGGGRRAQEAHHNTPVSTTMHPEQIWCLNKNP